MIKDSKGNIPNFVYRSGTLLHQPTGLRVEVNLENGDFDSAIRKAKSALDQKIKERQNAQSK